MIKIYKKINKTANNPYGCKEITNLNDIKNPFLLCISGYDNYSKSVFGIIREGAHAARVYTTQEIAAAFNIEQMPIDFLGYTYQESENKTANYLELAYCFLLPFIKLHGMNYQAVIKQARKINIFTYDIGVEKYVNAEKVMFNDLVKEGFSKEEAKTILKQICLIALGTTVDLSNIYATNFNFIDLNDKELQTPELLEYQKLLTEKCSPSMYVPMGENESIFYPFLGTGVHSVKEYLAMTSVAKPAICAVTVFCLQNSLANLRTATLLPMDRDDLYSPLYTYGANLRTVHDTMCILDNEVKYENAPKYTLNEVQLRIELDQICRRIQKQKISIQNKEKDSQDLSQRLNNVINSIRKFSSETTYYQILTDSHLWFSSNEVLSEDSDKIIREKYNQEHKVEQPEKQVKVEVVEEEKKEKKKPKKKATKKKEEKKEEKKATSSKKKQTKKKETKKK